MKYLPTIGLEIHAELKTESKMFCSCKNDSLERHPNLNICPICMGHPGTLPTINEKAVKKVIKVGLALNCKIAEYSKFDRKNYFYPDLPKGYQISQYDKPLCEGGYLDIPVLDKADNLPGSPSRFKRIRIRRIHLEEDTGKLVHPEGEDYSLVDFNRAGIPLMELVTEPDITSSEQARKFAQELQLILRYLGVSEADMEKGQLRLEANVSLSEVKDDKVSKLGTKVEIKNLNSFRSLEKAIEYEIERQKRLLLAGKKVIQETRGWDDTKQITFSQRSKEEAHDYRYFPEPDLPPLKLTKHYIDSIKAELPELPTQRRERLARQYNLSPFEVELFVVQKDLGEYFEKVMSELEEWVKEVEEKVKFSQEEFNKLTKLAANYLCTDLQGLLKGASVTGEDFLITPENFAELITLLYENKISSKIAKQVLSEMFATGKDPSQIIEEKGLSQITNELEIEKIVREVISENPKAVEDYKKGKTVAVQFLIGKVMAKTRGRVKPDMAQKLLIENLKNMEKV